MTFSRLQTLLLCAVVVLTSSLSLHGQSTYGTVDGTVTDSTGAVVAGAQVTLTNTGTQEKHTQTTGDAGLYTFVNVEPGNYRLDIEKSGFKHFARTNVVVQVQQETHIDATLPVGQASETVEVTAETPLLQAETSSLGQVIEERKANELPLNGRNVFNLITVSPGVVAQGGSGGTAVGQNPFSWGNYQVAGSFANQGAEYLDGQPLNIGYINLPIIIPTQDSIGEFKVQYNNVGAEWGKFSGAVTNFSTKSGTNGFHGELYEYLRAKILNANDYFNKESELASGLANEAPPYVQNNYGGNIGGPIIKDKTFFFVSEEQYRQRAGQVVVTSVPIAAFRMGDFSSLLPTEQLYDPYTTNVTGTPATNPNYGMKLPYPNNQIPSTEWSTAATALWDKYYTPVASSASSFTTGNYTSAASTGGNTNQFVARVDENLTDKTRMFGRFTYYGLLDLPNNPLGTGLCNDRCAEDYHTKALAFDVNHTFSPNLIGDLNISGSRFIYLRSPILAGYDLTQLGWPASYNSTVPSVLRTPPTPAFPFNGDIGKSQGNSGIGDHNTQYNVSPSITIIRGKHTIQAGAQYELGLDNYYQTNIASGAFGFKGSWTGVGGTADAWADFLLGLAQGGPSAFVNQTEGAAQVPSQTAGKQTYRALFADDTFKVLPKLTLNLGLRYELQGGWSERFGRLSYWNPTATNAAVTGCGGTLGSVCIGDASLVGTGFNSSGNNLPLDKKEFSPRVGFAYALDSKTVIRAGYGIFWIPNYVSFGLNPDNDVINLATTPFFATNNGYVSPIANLDESGCTYTQQAAVGTIGFSNCMSSPTGTGGGPFVGGILGPPGRNNFPAATPNLSSFVAANGSPTLAPYGNQKEGYVEQYNFDIQRQLPAGFFADVAYAGSHGVHLEQYNPNIDQIPDSAIAAANTQYNAAVSGPCAGLTGDAQVTCANGSVAIYQPVTTNPLVGANSGLEPPAVLRAGQLLRPYPQYSNLYLGGYGCCESIYNSVQISVTRRFIGGGNLLVAYTNAKLTSNTDTLTSWLEGSSETGGVGAVQDYNNLKGERSLSSQDVSQRLIISYVLDLPFGHGKMWASNFSGAMDRIVGGWGVDGITTFQRGFPLKITWAGAATSLENAGFGVGNIRPDVVPGCDKQSGGGHVSNWFNTNCFADPPQWGYGSEARVDPTLRAPGINNFDFAIFKRIPFNERFGLQFRTEFFNLFNHPQFAPPATGFGASGFGVITSDNGDANPRLIQFALKLVF